VEIPYPAISAKHALISGGNANLPARSSQEYLVGGKYLGNAEAPDGIVEVFSDPDDEGLKDRPGTVYRNTFQAAGYVKDDGV
jgi:hypothetical protein